MCLVWNKTFIVYLFISTVSFQNVSDYGPPQSSFHYLGISLITWKISRNVFPLRSLQLPASCFPVKYDLQKIKWITNRHHLSAWILFILHSVTSWVIVTLSPSLEWNYFLKILTISLLLNHLMFFVVGGFLRVWGSGVRHCIYIDPHTVPPW